MDMFHCVSNDVITKKELTIISLKTKQLVVINKGVHYCNWD